MAGPTVMLRAGLLGMLALMEGVALANGLPTDSWQSSPGPGTNVSYRIETRVAADPSPQRRFGAAQLQILEKLNRADIDSLGALQELVVPESWLEELRYSPFPLVYDDVQRVPKFLIVDLGAQAFAAYEWGRLTRWGPVSSGRRGSPTPGGRFYLNWRSAGRHSTVNPDWYMKWYFNFENTEGLSLHSHVLPGRPASHGCIRLLERDAAWIYSWGEGWTLDRRGQVRAPGTPLWVIGQYELDKSPPWRSLAALARGVTFPSDD
jgi:hypothetical protein